MFKLLKIRPLAAATALNALLAWSYASGAETELNVSMSDDWGGGFTANASFTNTTGTALDGWSLTFESPISISSIWNAQVLSHDGNTYVIGNASWNGAVAAGGSVQFGFSGSGSVNSPIPATVSGESTSENPGNTTGDTPNTGDSSAIVFANVDADGTALQVNIDPGLSTLTVEAPGTYAVATNNPDVLTPSVSGQTVTLDGLQAGRASLRIENTTTGDVRYLGVRVLNADGTAPALPDYLAIGSVSEDSAGDLGFWQDFTDGSQNKRVDIRYIYLNGGATNSIGSGWNWRSGEQDGQRATGYVEESIKLGMVPFFVWYNIPDGGESYYTDKQHIESSSYLEGYFSDLKYALEITKSVAGDEVIGWVIEPDFLGYFAQNNPASPDEIYAATSAAYSAGVLDAATDPTFPDTLAGLVQAINYTFQKYQPNAYFGWQFNLWASPAGGWTTPVGGRGVVRLTDSLGLNAGRTAIYNEASAIADYYLACGVASHGASFVSIDKYGLDAAYDGNAANPGNSIWFWNATHWTNYLIFVSGMHDTTELPVVLWQLPVGHINDSQATSNYSADGSFDVLDNTVQHYEDSSGTYFLGDSFKPGSDTRLTYFGATDGGTSDVTISGDTVTWGSHLDLAKEAGVVVALFGAGVGASTDGVGSPPTDDYWFISKVQDYYNNPVQLDGENDGIDLPDDSDNGNNDGNDNGNNGDEDNGEDNGNGGDDTGDPVSSSALVVTVSSDWGSGFTATATLTNTTDQDLENWTVTFEWPYAITSVWDAKLDSHNGDTYTVSSLAWNGALAAGQSVSFGFNGAPGNVQSQPVNVSLNGVNVSDGGNNGDDDNNNGEDNGNDDDNTGGDDDGEDNDNGDDTGEPVSSDALVVTVSSDWGSGFTATATLTNTTDQDLENWTVTFEWPYAITSVWDAKLDSHNGDTYTVSSLAWNGALAAGQSVSFGFNGAPGNVQSQPVNISLNGVNVSDGEDTTDNGNGEETGDDDNNNGDDNGTGDDDNDNGGTGTGDDDANDNDNSDGETNLSKRVVAYFPSWGVYARGYEVAKIPADSVTHIVHAFARIGPSGEIEIIDKEADLAKKFGDDTWDQELRGNFNQYQKLKAAHPHLKTMIAVGGWFDSGRFSAVAASAAAREKFAQSVVDFVVKYDFDGVDLDWEYPVVATDVNANVRPEDSTNYALLAKALRQALNAQGAIDGKTYEISAATPAGYDKYEKIDLAALAEQLDWFNLMTYDFHGRWDRTRTGHNAPMTANPNDPMQAYNVTSAVQGYLDAGVPAAKITLGVPLYGFIWTGVNSTNNGLYQSASGLGAGTAEVGILDYRTIVEMMQADPSGYAERWDEDSQVSYLYNPNASGGTFVTYDSPTSVSNKLDYIDNMNLGGVMFWEISNDVRDNNSDDSITKLVGERYRAAAEEVETVGAN